MLNSIIRFSLKQPLLIIGLAVVLMSVGAWETTRLPVDVFPDLDRPRVVIITEAHGLAPEEVETLINVPIESAMNGATGVEAVRSSAGIGISVIYVEFAWGTNIYTDRQIVGERLDLVQDRLPEDVQPQLAPISSIMGQIMLVGMWVEKVEGRESSVESKNSSLSTLDFRPSTSLLDLRDHADWLVRRRLMNIQGVAQVFVMGGEGGGRRQVQVLVNPHDLRRLDVSLHQVEEALAESNDNATGGYFENGPNRLLVRGIGRIESIEELESLVVDGQREPPVLLGQVARVVDGPEIPVGRSAVKDHPAVMLTIVKQPGIDTRKLTSEVDDALKKIRLALPSDARISTEVYRMDHFIDRAIANVLHALRDGGILVVIILFVFLLNFRTTMITLTAIPLSLAVTVFVFRWLGLSINTMTLGGIAVAIGELVDDAIVDVENIYRRLRENRMSPNPRPALLVVYQASLEVRNSIVFATMLVVLVFVPLFALGSMEGRLFTPLGIAYIVSILASLLVSLTVTPVLCWWLLPRAKFMEREEEGLVLRTLREWSGKAIGWSVENRQLVLVTATLVAVLSIVVLTSRGRNFLPPFNEGSVQVSVALPPETSLEQTDRIVGQIDRALLNLDFITSVGRRTGRAEEDEHVAGVSFSEIILELNPASRRSRDEQLAMIRDALDTVPGVESSSGRSTTEQPISHLMSHMLTGVKAQIAIKVYGDDLAVLRNVAQEIRGAIEGADGVVDLAVEQQVLIPQMQIRVNRGKLAQHGLRPGDVNHVVETAMQGRVVSQFLQQQRSYDVVVRLDDKFRNDTYEIKNLAIDLPSHGSIPLVDVAHVHLDRMGPNSINREGGRRRIVIQCNSDGRAMSEVRQEIETRLQPIEEKLSEFGSGYYIEYGGQFESEQAATRLLLLLSIVALIGTFNVLYALFRSVNLSLQVMAALPMAAIGGVAALLLTGQNLSVPSMVGFITLAGIASRNGILLISHYLHLMRHEGEELTPHMIIRGGQERVAPVLMTALTSGIGLLPLALAAGQPGKEILYPVATVIIGGLISSTLLEFFVRPALFWTYGQDAAKQLLEPELAQDELLDA